jgi:hypothetical protein
MANEKEPADGSELSMDDIDPSELDEISGGRGLFISPTLRADGEGDDGGSPIPAPMQPASPHPSPV